MWTNEQREILKAICLFFEDKKKSFFKQKKNFEVRKNFDFIKNDLKSLWMSKNGIFGWHFLAQ